MINITNIQYIPTPFRGHRVLSFAEKHETEKGKGYYKMNTSILKDAKYKEIVDETIQEVEKLQIKDEIRKWCTFIQSIRSKSVSYSQEKCQMKTKVKETLKSNILKIEENPSQILKQEILDQYNYYQGKLKEIEQTEIEGYKRRVKYIPSFDKEEPDIAFYSKIEERKISESIIGQLAERQDEKIYTDTKNMMNIASEFYTDLYTPDKVDSKMQDKLLGNIKNRISQEQKEKLDSPITIEELKTALFQMQSKKSPGLDGIPVEFYQEYWEDIKYYYLDYINKVKKAAFPLGRNTSVIKIIYKKTGEIYLLVNYRPISLINVDIKILTKALANRLKYVIPSIIHVSQTAVYGRKIDQTIHMIRDLIDIANKDDDSAAFLFLDQEKAFDRVNHEFLYKTMRAFGIGEDFIRWVSTIYSNASAVLNINGFLSKRIPLKRGVRQGCPLSALLYVLIIEVLAIQLRINPNIVGL